MRRRNIVISVPNNNAKQITYLPAIWAVLKTHCDKIAGLKERFTWLDAIITKGSPESLLEPYGGVCIDVLGISCYSWNTKTNFALASVIRERYPECLIVAGGPNLDYRNEDFFKLHPYVDAIVLKDGEIPFGMVLQQVAADELQLRTIPGLIVPPSATERALGNTFIATGEPILPTVFPDSPWLTHKTYFEAMIARLRADNPAQPIAVPWEIDRGCPYNCSFCDWGSNTHSRVRTIPLSNLREESQWFGKNKIYNVFLTVANFGSNERDEAVLDFMIDTKRQYSFPKIHIWSNAKNNVARVAAMSMKAFDAGIIDHHVLSVQSLDEDVLAAMGRSTIDKRQLIQVAEIMSNEEIPCAAQLIFGGPGDSLEKFLCSLTGLMEIDIHDDYIAYPFEILANAPANSQKYREKWSIRTITRRGQVNRRDPHAEDDDMATIIVETSSYSRREFIDMYVWGRLIIALHNSGATQFIARYLRRTHSISYLDFYKTVGGSLFSDTDGMMHAAYKHCHDHIAAYVGEGGEHRSESMILEDVPQLEYMVNVEEYLLCYLMKNLDSFYAGLQSVLLRNFGSLDLLKSVLLYQRGVMIDLAYDRRVGRKLTLEHDWPDFFAKHSTLDVPNQQSVEVMISRTHSGSQQQYPLDWWELAATAEEALPIWIKRIVGKHYQRVERSYFRGVGRPVSELSRRGRRHSQMLEALALNG